MAGLSDFIGELRRRNVFRLVAAYAVAAWLIVQIASIVLPAFHAAEWIMQAVLVLVVLCFPLAIAVSEFDELSDCHRHRRRSTISGGRRSRYKFVAGFSAADCRENTGRLLRLLGVRCADLRLAGQDRF